MGSTPRVTEQALPEAKPKGASRGQVVVMFGVFLVGLMGLLALATDLGVAFAERRAMQNAADAGALAGARQVARWTAADPTAAGRPPVRGFGDHGAPPPAPPGRPTKAPYA